MDLIDRQQAIDAAMQDVSCIRTHEFNAGATRAANRIKQLPPAEPKRGKWKNIVDGIEYTWGTCDTCGAHIPMPYKYYEYCPHCGTKNEVEHG